MTDYERRELPKTRAEQAHLDAFNDAGKPIVYYDSDTNRYLRVLCSAEDVRARVETIADKIAEDYRDKQPLVLLTVTEGGNPLTELLAPALERRGLHFDQHSIKAQASAGPKNQPSVDWQDTPPEAVDEKHVLLIEDALSSGMTLDAVRASVLRAGALSANAAILVDGQRMFDDDKVYEAGASKTEMYKGNTHYYCLGIDIDSLFQTYGVGMDMKGQYRDLPCILVAFEEEERAASANVGLPPP